MSLPAGKMNFASWQNEFGQLLAGTYASSGVPSVFGGHPMVCLISSSTGPVSVISFSYLCEISFHGPEPSHARRLMEGWESIGCSKGQ